jgi:hypothetical protein
MSIARSKKNLRTALLALALPAIALPSTVTGVAKSGTSTVTTATGSAPAAVGSVVLAGPTVGPNSAYNATSFNQVVTLADGDVYDVSGNYFASYTDAAGTAIHINPTVVYEGSSPSVANDNISIIFTQQFFDSRPGTWDGTYTASTPVNFSGLVGAGSSVTAEVFYDGQSLGSGTATGGVINSSANLTGLNGDTLTGTYDITYSLNAGTQPGAGANSSSVPEPTEALPVGLGLAGVLYAVARRKKSA